MHCASPPMLYHTTWRHCFEPTYKRKNYTYQALSATSVQLNATYGSRLSQHNLNLCTWFMIALCHFITSCSLEIVDHSIFHLVNLAYKDRYMNPRTCPKAS
eukprot:c39825_g1_i1 orf=2-301(-)